MKSRRYGLGFEYNKTTNRKRLSVLILLSSLAHSLLMVFGMMARLENKHRHYQANSLKTNNVLSLQFIGKRAVSDRWYKSTIASFRSAIKKLQETSGCIEYATL